MPLNRHDVLRTSGTLMAQLALPRLASAAPAEPVYGRAILPIDRGWRYSPSRVGGAESPSFDDSGLERVVIPHTNISQPWHSFSEKDYTFVSTEVR